MPPHNQQQDTINLEVSRSLGRIEQGLKDLSVKIDETNKVLLRHDTSINKLENQQIVLETKASIFGGGAGFIMTFLLLWIRDKLKI